MKKPEIPANETDRVEALQKLNILYTPAEERFDRITRLASRLFNVPIALVSLVSADKQWFKSRQGLNAPETSRDISFCGHAILSDDIFVVPNAWKDPDFRDNPLVTGPPAIRFYAGQPLHFEQQRIGTLCVIDTKPRLLRPHEYDSLQGLARWIELELLDWSATDDSLMQQVLGLNQRETLIDPLTGDLNTEGITCALQNLNQQQLVGELRITLVNFDTIADAQTAIQVRVTLANKIRSTFNDMALIGFEKSDTFLLLLSDEARQFANLKIAALEKALAELQRAGEIPENISFAVQQGPSPD